MVVINLTKDAMHCSLGLYQHGGDKPYNRCYALQCRFIMTWG